jgi:DNA-binding GntR family transcriptional regulator
MSVLEHLRGQIITFQLKGGQKLNENQLSSQLNISRPPMREAFQILEQEHFIVSIPRKGRYVTEISEKNYEKIHQTRMMIECYVIDLLEAMNVRSLPIVDLVSAEVLKEPMLTDDPYEKWHYIEAMDKFHVGLVESVGNELLSRFYETIRFNISRYKYWLRVICSPQHLLGSDITKSIIEEHCRVLDFIKRGEYDQARDCLRFHMEKTWKEIKENFLKSEVPGIETRHIAN